jgi:prepilin-type N-terminal cleavage/methylation domain-containing protein
MKIKGKGFTLIEMLLVLALSALAMISLLEYQIQQSKIRVAESVGEQFKNVGDALGSYISLESQTLVANIPSGTSATIPINVLEGTTVGAYPGKPILPNTFSNTNAFNSNYVIQIYNNAGALSGLVLSSAPVVDTDGTTIKYDWIGAAMKKMGANSGMTFNSGTTFSGFDGAFSLPNTEFSAINAPGQLGYYVSTTAISPYDQIYLRLDGTNSMLADLDVGNHNIKNVTNINYSGWANGYGLLVNTIQSSNINNAQNITTTNLTATNTVIADNVMQTRDIYLGNNPNAPAQAPTGRALPNAWLSDLLPKYSSRGVYLVYNGSTIAKPTCSTNGTAVPRIEVIPQYVNSEGAVEGPLYPYGGNGVFIYQQQWSAQSTAAYATDNGSYWTVYLQSSYYGWPGSNFQIGLAHVFCDYGF